MKKIMSIGLLGLSFTVFFSLLSPAYAALDLKRAILVPGNPLYFIKEFSRSVQRTLAVDAVSKAELELGIADSFASEIVTVSEENPEKITAAVGKYSAELDLLKEKISAIGPGENTGRFLGSLTEKSLAHDRLLSSVAADYSIDVRGARKKIISVLAFAEKRPGGNDGDVQGRFSPMISDIDSNENAVAILDFLIRFGDESGIFMSEPKDAVVMRMDGLIRSSVSRLASLSGKVSSVREIPGRLRLALEIKERTSDIALENRMGTGIQTVLDRGDESLVSSEDAAAEIASAEKIEAELSSIVLAYSSEEIITSIDSILSAARDRHAESMNVSAFILAKTASVIASRHLSDISASRSELSAKVSSLREEYERAFEGAKSKGLSASKNLVLWSRFAETEKILNGAQTASSAREAEKLISELKVLIADPSENAEDRPVFCPAVYDPVCGESGITYSNGCIAASAGVSVKSKGTCK